MSFCKITSIFNFIKLNINLDTMGRWGGNKKEEIKLNKPGIVLLLNQQPVVSAGKDRKS